ncbi:hypothetical protein A3J19_04235 [Candidatus Daviesbacteria bacterium RIFCSPLOWO2_02_FULL_41_8]|uniref:Uncharacterized protein n=3 Tax=Candidatus Daviesiibacteriota TaxID=1752718 RepID=A0A1F5NM14_9BACT|nr:MAG: hypothetical protein A2871_00715 [Candidatus Daviesbacteria bacterium RIFCSPHIGHO2_01_FULL_41_23]OGE33427.1 MAG: hypothetical protein A3D83_00325 [Candidatus Daviesbacteria bacterium RIFCSPHIGHO2_02_FULL_41_10]OGE62417.1 MAG: hypothetical protein A2967_01205 [Candidatus Daviesbacteria bacterium RIFCSPLOWO2_01_FULL_41_32]OGE78554.1 MAG: hypothetical protein A3J19_04235 [Candidatus Daviesbacteria bacterium RIFCSPLOWO2_02_FULL_41_8]
MKALGIKQVITIIVVLVLVVGLVVGIYLVQKQQTLKSKATTSFVNAFEIKDSNGNVITCDASTNPPTCNTPTLDINVKVIDKALLVP